LDKTGYEKVEIQAALWYNIFLTTKVNDNPVGFTGIKKSRFEKDGKP
jgi:hypothetical protein